MLPLAYCLPIVNIPAPLNIPVSISPALRAPIAAVDIGSNSFRLEIARFEHGHLERLAYLKETVRLGSGLDAQRYLSAAAAERAVACLRRFRERLQGFGPDQVRAVATQTVREARNREAFMVLASEALGFPVEMIAGTEEARLIYRGMCHFLPHSAERRLAIDIGGRSTELIIGQHAHIYHANSYRIGSVSWSMKFFARGELSASAFKQAELTAQALFETALVDYPRAAWERAYGSSGTVGAVAELLAARGETPGQISLAALKDLRHSMLRARSVDALQLGGLKDDRRPVLAGGVSVLLALMQLLRIDTVEVARGALRHGVLLEVAEVANSYASSAHCTEQLNDIRERSVARLWRKLAVDPEQAQRVQQLALYFYDQLHAARLSPKQTQIVSVGQQQLRYAAQLHEVGAVIGLSDYHKHSAYIVEHAELPGFSITELERLGLLILGQKGKLRKLGDALDDAQLLTKLLCLRLSLIFCHARQAPPPDCGKLQAMQAAQGWCLHLPPNFEQQYPLTHHLLEAETQAWEHTAWQLQLQLQLQQEQAV